MINRKKTLGISESRIIEMIKECYWEYNVTSDEILDIVDGEDIRKKKKLFEKIIYNSTHKYLLLTSLFDKNTLREFFDGLKITYNNRFITRQTILLRNFLFDEKNIIRVLEWEKR
jgi:hypothetical protein